jgi:hypothetical protein
LPATWIAPVRAGPLLAATWTRTVALAVPLAPLAIVSQAASADAVQEQPVRVARSKLTAPPSALTPSPERLSEKVQAAAACESET